MDVFISYSSREYEDAFAINSILLKNGISTWMAPDSIPAGSNYTKEIPNAIRNCKVFLLILSKSAQQSVWVSAELENAFKNEKFILPFVLDNCPLNDEFDFLLSRSQRISAYETKAEALNKLVNRIKAMLNADTGAATEVVIQEAPADYETINLSGGLVYEGQVMDGKRTGKGTLTWPDGGYYQGDFIDGQRTGKGKFVWCDGSVYEGDFIDGTRHGKGKYTGPKGVVYKGEYVDGKRQGKGVLTWPSGDVYEGDFFDGDRTGKGIYRWKNGDIYEGDYLKDLRHGKGFLRWSDGSTFEGDFLDGKRTGKGKYTSVKGNIYEGDYLDGKRTGKGKYTWTNGHYYEGEFFEGTFCGEGIYYGETIKEGTWKDDNLMVGFERDKDGALIAEYRGGEKLVKEDA